MKKVSKYLLLSGAVLSLAIGIDKSQDAFTIIASAETSNSQNQTVNSIDDKLKDENEISTKNEDNPSEIKNSSTNAIQNSDKEPKDNKDVLSDDDIRKDALTSTYNVEENIKPSLAMDAWTRVPEQGKYVFKNKCIIKDSPTKNGKIITYFDKGMSVNYDSKVSIDGQTWISYVSFGGNRYYVQIDEQKPEPKPDNEWKLVPENGTYKFTFSCPIKSEPKKSSSTVATYEKGMTVNYDNKVTYDGADWISYIASSGARRYVQISQNNEQAADAKYKVGDIVQLGSGARYESNGNNISERQGWIGTIKEVRVDKKSHSNYSYKIVFSSGSATLQNNYVLEQDIQKPTKSPKYQVGDNVQLGNGARYESDGNNISARRGWIGTVKEVNVDNMSHSNYSYKVEYKNGNLNTCILEQDLQLPKPDSNSSDAKYKVGDTVQLGSGARYESNGNNISERQGWIGTIKEVRVDKKSHSNYSYKIVFSSGSATLQNNYVLEQDIQKPTKSPKYQVGDNVQLGNGARYESDGNNISARRGWVGTVKEVNVDNMSHSNYSYKVEYKDGNLNTCILEQDLQLPKEGSKPNDTWKLVPESGTYTFTTRTGVKNEPKKSSPDLAFYDKGMTVVYDNIVTNDGVKWISYIAGSGARRYVQITTDSSGNNNQNKGMTIVNGILIVNKKNSIPSTYAPGENSEAIANLRKLISAMRASGMDVSNSYSGYRSYATQAQLYQSYVNRDGKAAADTYSARPGFSEHQTGLAFDLLRSDGSLIVSARESNWIAQNAHKYGFIVRFPEGKDSITGYQYEPWHVRYVGNKATSIYNSGKTLEEYLGVPGGGYR
ncbi:hypothetical protein BG261_04260 [Floricoccus tropicus]|uniref:SH3b domain-containing protein n=1 Tax=Floricoccus tropicus TaxID=1859473 RepID=A0A1E8GN85_9LACT|nr:SH3 domain-containing protein [Floricoccus tropicus]OFI49093.1 hypothetical protein BG261_04260 [Floricoccus tropicus]